MTSTDTQRTARAGPRIRHGAALPPPAIAYALLTIAAAVVPTLLAGHAAWTSDSNMLDVYLHHRDAVRAQALLTTAAAIPLAVFSAIVSDRIRALGLRVPGRLIALVGGAGAAALLAVSGLISLALLSSHATDSLPLLRFGQRLSVALGGTGFAAFTGLLVAGVAVTGLLGRLLPRPLAIAGLVIAALCELALATTLTDAAAALLPIARFGSLAFLVATAFTLHRRAV